MPYNNLIVEKKDNVLYVTVNRPKALNALNEKTLEDLELAIAEAKADDDVLAIVLTGAGDKAFVAGADISEITGLGHDSGVEFSRKGQQLFGKIENLGKPVIAAVNGFALGGGCELCMACTIRIASEKAMFGQPEAKLGLIPGYGGTQRLPRLIGTSNALYLTLTAEMITASRAFELGLVSKVVPPEALMTEVEGIAKRITSMGPLAIRAAIEAIRAASVPGFEYGQMLEAELFGAVCATDDMREGTEAFLQKRKPQFKGN